MIKTILFDLDGTLLSNDVFGTFLPHYFALIAKHIAQYTEPVKFLEDLNYCVQGVIASTDTVINNHDLFWRLFEQRTGLNSAEMEPFLERFYQEQFPKLASLTQMRPIAADVIRACFDLNLHVVIATNPIFPISAIEQRLAWAGIPVSKYQYDLVTSYENMHSAKPNPAYYKEILARIQCVPNTAVMVGDSWENDIVPAKEAGLYTYWINEDNPGEPPDSKLINGYGSLKEFHALLADGWLNSLTH